LTGFVVDDMEGAIEAVSRLGQLDRAAIRARFEQRFTAERMAKDYVAVYSSLTTMVELPLVSPADRLPDGRGAVPGEHVDTAQVA